MEIKILLIEDDQFLRELCGKALEQAGYSVFCLPDPRKVYEILNKENIDLIISGIMMPHKDGMVLLKELKANPKYKDIPFIIWSNLGREEFIKKALNLGAEMFLAKSELTPQGLVEEIDKFISDSPVKGFDWKLLSTAKEGGVERLAQAKPHSRKLVKFLIFIGLSAVFYFLAILLWNDFSCDEFGSCQKFGEMLLGFAQAIVYVTYFSLPIVISALLTKFWNE